MIILGEHLIIVGGAAAINWIMYAMNISPVSFAAAGFLTGLLFLMICAKQVC